MKRAIMATDIAGGCTIAVILGTAGLSIWAQLGIGFLCVVAQAYVFVMWKR